MQKISIDNIDTASLSTVFVTNAAGPVLNKITTVYVTDSSYNNTSVTAVDVTGGYIKIVGTGFVSGCQVLINTVPAAATTFISSTEVRAQVNATTAGTYIVYLVNPDGGTAIRVNGITFSTVPTWATSSTLTTGASNIAISIQLSASSDSATTFSVASGSTLPAGLALSSSGLLSGTVTGLLVATLYSFTVVATDSELQTNPRTFNITISAGDPYFAYTTLLLSGATTTSTFIADASTNNFAVAIAGDTKPNNFNPYTPGYYSNYFDGTGDYLTVPYSSVFDYGTGDFTIEAWIYLTITPYQGDAIFCSLTTGGSAFQFYSSTQLALGNTGIAWRAISNSTSFPICTWHHVAVSRASGTAYFWLNGVNIGTVAETNAFNAASSAIAIGKSDGGLFTGYISNLRVLKGTALYTTTFTPSTTPLTAIANTSLLTCQSNRFVDNSTNAFVVTKYGDTTVSSATPFVPNTTYATYGSTYFDGTGDYLTVPSNAAFAMGSGDFTIEMWVYPVSIPTDTPLIDGRDGAGTAVKPCLFIQQSSNNFIYYVNGGIRIQGGTPSLKTWQHVALVRNSGSTKFYINGTQAGSTYTDTNNYLTCGYRIAAFNDGSTSYCLNGYISNVRVVNGVAVYTSAFTPPSTPLTAITNTSLLTLQTNQPASNSVFLDSSTNAFSITRAGNTSAGTFTPYGANWSLYTNGTSSYAYLPYSATRAIGTGDFSIECWVYIARQPANFTRIWSHQSSWGLAGSIGVELAFGTVDTLIQTLVDGNSQTYTSATYDTGNGSGHVRQWIHVVSSRQNGYLRLFVNGILREANTNSTNINGTSNTSFGTNSQMGGDLTEMYISNFRMCIGSVPTLYSTTSTTAGTTIFTPSTTPVTTTSQGASGVQLLLFQDNRIIDRSSNAFAVTTVGNPSIQRFSPFSPGAAYSTSTIGGSVYFDGNGDYLTAPANAAFDFGTGDFTIEVWVYPISNGLNYPTFLGSVTGWSDGASGHRFNNTGYANKFWFGRNGSGGVASGDPFMASTNTFSFNVWHHYSITRSGNTFRMFVNGALENTQTFSGSYNAGLGGLRSGWSTWDGAGGYFTGYTSNLRMLKGTALYTTTFTPPTAPLTAITNTSLLLNMTSAGIVDATMINDLETVGDATILSTQTPYAGSYYSNYFDGTGDYLSAAASSNFDFGSENFTIETWFYAINEGMLFSNDDDINNGGVVSGSIALSFSGAGIFFYRRQTSGAWAEEFSYSGAIAQNTWHHVAVVKSGTNIKIFFNGSSVLSTTAVNTTFGTSAKPFSIGSRFVTNYRSYLNGYISNLRVVKGTAVYTGTFTPPTAPLSATQAAGTNISAITGTATSLLTCQSNSFLDNSTNLFTITRAGDTSVQSFNPFQRNSAATLYFDGTGDALTLPANNIFATGTGDFTIEGWIYVTDLSAVRTICGTRTPPDTTTGWNLAVLTTGSMQIYDNTGYAATGAGSVAVNTWCHFAFVRLNNVFYSYLNGIQKASSACTRDWTQNTFWVGATGGSSQPFIGYINDLRLTRGYARYTSTFTPPTSALTVQ